MDRKTYTPGELTQILADHRLWRETDGSRGTRANLTRADLTDANLAGANLTDAYLAGANLAGAYLAGANLAGAYLAGADLTDANLAGANLTDAYLAGANLTDAYLTRADLTCANLTDANLAGAYLADANLTCANLTCANLTDAYLTRADLTCANLADANLAGAYLAGEQIPVIDQLDVKVLEAIEKEPKSFYMSTWHSFRDPAQGGERAGDSAADIGVERAIELGNACGTTHCRAGFAIHIAGKAGYELEAKLGAQVAGTLIYLKSTGRVPDFGADEDDALEDIRKCAAEQLAAAKQESR